MCASGKAPGNSKAGTEQNNTINGMKQFKQDDIFRFFRGEFFRGELTHLRIRFFPVSRFGTLE